MENLFLDANILLDFYRFGEDDISEIGKLVILIRDKEIRLHSNDHLKNEVARKREGEISQSFGELRATKYKVRAPSYCYRMKEFKDLTEALKLANKFHGDLVTAVESAITAHKLPADALIKSIFDAADNLAVDDHILARARLRRDLNNPPGKKEALGDAIHWECLLKKRPYSLHIVSRDGDFASELNPKEIKSFLQDEWVGVTKFGKVTLFKSLSEYFKAKFPDIKLSEESQKNELISRLESSPNFSSTHSIIADLSKYVFYTNHQVIRLFEALVKNDQVGWISSDSDVREFYLKLKDKAYIVPDELQDAASELLGIDKSDFFFPF